MTTVDRPSYSYGHSGIVLTAAQMKVLKAIYDVQSARYKSNPNMVDHAVPLYQFLIDTIKGINLKSVASKQVLAWLEGASEVNSGQGTYSDFIREYTISQYAYRYGAALTKETNAVSNGIGIKLIEGILNNNGIIPSIEGLAVFDAGEAAQGIFSGKYFPTGDYAGWAGTLLFPFLGYDRMYKEWMLTDNYVIANLAGRSTLIKNINGTYDLIAALQGTQETYKKIGLDGKISAYLKNLTLDIPQNFKLLKSMTDAYLVAHYTLPESHRFKISLDLPFAGIIDNIGKVFVPQVSYKVGTLGHDIIILDKKALHGIVNTGAGNDIVGANPEGGNWIIDLYNAGKYVSTPQIQPSKNDLITYDGNQSKYGASIQLDMAYEYINNKNYSQYLKVEKKLEGSVLLGTDLIYDADMVSAFIGADVLRVSDKDFAPTGKPKTDTLNFREGGLIGDTLDFSMVSNGLDVSLVPGGVLFGNNVNFLHTVTSVENVIGTHHDDFIKGDGTRNTLVGLGGTNYLSGGLSADTFVVGQMGAHDIIVDAKSDDRLYMRSATNKLIPLKVGFLPYSKIEGGSEVQLKPGGSSAFFNPMKVTNPTTFRSEVGVAKETISSEVGEGIFIRYSLSSHDVLGMANDLNIDIYYLNERGRIVDNADVTIKNFSSGMLGLQFKKIVEPNYAIADYSHASSKIMKVNIENYQNAHLEALHLSRPFHFDDSHLDLWMI